MHCSPFKLWWEQLPQALSQGKPAVLVSIVRVQGSSPRETGASMLVESDTTTDTLGGGELEFQAIHTAQRMLLGEVVNPLMRYVLGPELGQCCGGIVWLLFERTGAESYYNWQQRHTYLLEGVRLLRHWQADGTPSRWIPLAEHDKAQSQLTLGDIWHGQQVFGNIDFHVRLFGAGHVGQALIQVLANTDCRLQWIDERPNQFSSLSDKRVQVRHSTRALEAVIDAPPATWFIVMTHSHALDFELVEAILMRGDAAFCGLIGSSSKAARLRHRLRDRGIPSSRIEELTCPIGIPGITNKTPQSIAIAIAAQLLQKRDSLRMKLSEPDYASAQAMEFHT